MKYYDDRNMRQKRCSSSRQEHLGSSSLPVVSNKKAVEQAWAADAASKRHTVWGIHLLQPAKRWQQHQRIQHLCAWMLQLLAAFYD